MSKVALITDSHFGIKEGRGIFHDYFEKFYTNTFFPTLKERGITKVLHLGDLFDKRKSIDFGSIKRSREYFFDPMRDQGIEMAVLVGNHDIALRNTLEINSPELLLREYPNIATIKDPQVVNIDGLDVLLMPWICTDNYSQSMETMKAARAGVCMGHFEIQGFAMARGMDAHEGFATNIFDRFDMVFSGHFHHKSSKGNITYLGNPYQLTHQDQGDVRGFHIFDTATRELEFIPNPYEMFTRFVYDDTNDNKIFDVTQFEDKYVKVVVARKTDFYAFDTFMERVHASGAHDIKVMEALSDMTSNELDEKVDVADTQTVLQHFIDSAELNDGVDRAKLSAYMKTLYVEASHFA